MFNSGWNNFLEKDINYPNELKMKWETWIENSHGRETEKLIFFFLLWQKETKPADVPGLQKPLTPKQTDTR